MLKKLKTVFRCSVNKAWSFPAHCFQYKLISMGISALPLLSKDSLHHEKLVLDTSSPRRQSLKVAPSSVSSTHLLSSVESQCFHKEQKLTNKKTRLLTTQWCFHENQTPQKSHFTYSTNPQKPVRIKKKNLHHVARLHKKNKSGLEKMWLTLKSYKTDKKKTGEELIAGWRLCAFMLQ